MEFVRVLLMRHGNWRMDWGDAALADHAIDPDVDKIHCFLRGEISQWAQAHNRPPKHASNSRRNPPIQLLLPD
ncbi:sulfite reductase hemoprotein [Colletotrichum scovillei]|uniref:Sulfite reductase hemoprotein n=1 Tax=Colletotrichum scovillei TaxID=1209932 RepID=A0A9P7UBI0_9PEZI|nr:sulfite reductase hemoprotein [Colletotrichum scovillei]KAG7065447.1 sulfite reductase hemoprotein [Colletotrichum scovillei]KAG7068051.1 sulfite reductase hemoprotein [Colletotrichum scovillei]